MLIATLFSLPACNLIDRKPAEAGGKPAAGMNLDAASLNATNATSKADEAQSKVNAENQATLEKVKANVISARKSNQENPDGLPKVKVDSELGVAESHLSSVKPDPVELAKSAANALLVEQGHTEEARRAYQKAMDDGKAQSAELVKAKLESEKAAAERDVARAAELKAQDEYKAQMIKNQVEFNRRLKEAQDLAMQEQVKGLNWASFACIVVFGLGLGFGGPAGLKITWPFAVISALCLGLAQLVAIAWFKWACLGAIIVALGVCGWWVWSRYKMEAQRDEAEDKAGKLNSVLTSVIPVLDKAYENGEQTTKDVLDKAVFQPLSEKMNRDEKSLIHTIRASDPAVPAP